MRNSCGLTIYTLNLSLIMQTTELSSNQLIENWILDVLSKPNSKFADMPPCPFARKAWAEGKVVIKKFVSFNQVKEDIKFVKDRVMIFTFGENCLPTCKDLAILAKDFNLQFPDLVFYDEHPDTIEEVGGVKLNSGMCALIVQNRKEILEKRAELQKTGYYDNWKPEMKERIFGS